jgi:hypothetical protein
VSVCPGCTALVAFLQFRVCFRNSLQLARRLTCVQIENGALQIIPGSHAFPISPTGDQLTEDEASVHAPPERRRFVLLKRGEVIVLHNWCLHRSELNTTDAGRRGLSVCYIDAATTLRPGEMGDEARAAAIESALHPLDYDADSSSSALPGDRSKRGAEAAQEHAEDTSGGESEDMRKSKLWPQIFPAFLPAAGPRHVTGGKL